MYNYGYDGVGTYDGYSYGYGYGWNYGNGILGSDDNCAACAGGKIGCGWTTYGNNILYGGPCRTVKFIRKENRCICGEDVLVLVPDMEFFERFKFDMRKCANFYAELCVCIEFGDTRKVFLATSPCCDKLVALESQKNGFVLQADQIQPFSNGHCKLMMTNCYDCGVNDHVTLANYYRAHAKCNCRKDKCCECGEVDGVVDGIGGIVAPY